MTEFVGLPLAALLRLCHHWLGSYGGAILVFTALTKLILLPVSLWVQSNSVRLVALTPRLNRLKLKYYGDQDTIAEETLALYKQRGYHPLLSTVPMILQLVLSMTGSNFANPVLAYLFSSSIRSGCVAMVGGLVIVPIVSAFTKKMDPARADALFSCYDSPVTTTVISDLGRQ